VSFDGVLPGGIRRRALARHRLRGCVDRRVWIVLERGSNLLPDIRQVLDGLEGREPDAMVGEVVQCRRDEQVEDVGGRGTRRGFEQSAKHRHRRDGEVASLAHRLPGEREASWVAGGFEGPQYCDFRLSGGRALVCRDQAIDGARPDHTQPGDSSFSPHFIVGPERIDPVPDFGSRRRLDDHCG
jgi:hypothetical protein